MALISSVKFSEDIPSHVRKLLDRVADFSKDNRWEVAAPLSKVALEELENVLESDSRDVGLLLAIVGFIETKLEKFDDAESVWKRAIKILEKDDKESKFAVTILRNLVESFTQKKRYEEAEVFGKKAVEIYEKLDDIDAFELADQKAVLGDICLRLKKPNDAKELLQAALPAFTEKFGSGSAQVEAIWRSLEAAYFWKNNVDESKESFKNSNDIEDAEALCLLGKFCETESFHNQAVGYYQRAVKIYESWHGVNHPLVADVSLKLGKCYYKIGNCLGSQLYLDKSHAIYLETLTPEDPMMLDVKIHLAFCYVKSARLEQARKIYEGILGNVDTDAGVPILKLAADYQKSGEHKVPTVNEKCDIINCALKNLSALYVLDGRYRAAKILQDFGESQYDLVEDDRI